MRNRILIGLHLLAIVGLATALFTVAPSTLGPVNDATLTESSADGTATPALTAPIDKELMTLGIIVRGEPSLRAKLEPFIAPASVLKKPNALALVVIMRGPDPVGAQLLM